MKPGRQDLGTISFALLDPSSLGVNVGVSNERCLSIFDIKLRQLYEPFQSAPCVRSAASRRCCKTLPCYSTRLKSESCDFLNGIFLAYELFVKAHVTGRPHSWWAADSRSLGLRLFQIQAFVCFSISKRSWVRPTYDERPASMACSICPGTRHLAEEVGKAVLLSH